MSTNPGSVIGTNAAYGGRTSVKAFNDILEIVTIKRGILSGWTCSPLAGMTIQLGGNAADRDVAIACNAVGDRMTINNRSELPIEITLGEAPESGARIDAVVAYVVDPPIGQATYVDNPDACGLIVVSGVNGESPVAPDDGAIRTAITLDGESGETAYYVVLAYIRVGAGVTNITSSDITGGERADIKNTTIDNASKVNGHTVESNVPGNAKFTDTLPNDSTIVVKINGVEAGRFTTNASSDKDINIPTATTSRYGAVQLSDSTSSTSTSLAATANAVRKAYVLASGKGVGNILYGESEPSSSVGSNGDIYVVYSD